MERSIPAIFDAGVFHPLVPVELPPGTPVEVRLQVSTKPIADEVDEETKRAWQSYLDRMESLPDKSPADGFSNRDHDRIVYGG